MLFPLACQFSAERKNTNGKFHEVPFAHDTKHIGNCIQIPLFTPYIRHKACGAEYPDSYSLPPYGARKRASNGEILPRRYKARQRARERKNRKSLTHCRRPYLLEIPLFYRDFQARNSPRVFNQPKSPLFLFPLSCWINNVVRRSAAKIKRRLLCSAWAWYFCLLSLIRSFGLSNTFAKIHTGGYYAIRSYHNVDYLFIRHSPPRLRLWLILHYIRTSRP